MDKLYNHPVDLFSIGVIAYLMLTGTLPFNSKNEQEIAKYFLIYYVRLTITKNPAFPAKIWKNISEEAKDFVSSINYNNSQIYYLKIL